jgi:hypothetical protein
MTATFQSRTYAQDRFKATSRNLRLRTRQVVQAVMDMVIMMMFTVVDADEDANADAADAVASDVSYFYAIL